MTENPNTAPGNPIFTELQSMNKRLLNLDEDINRIDRDLATDRQDIENLKINMAKIQNTLDSIMGILTRFQMKTKDAVKDAVTEANAPIEKQMKQFVNKKVIRVRVPAIRWTDKFKIWWKETMIGGE